MRRITMNYRFFVDTGVEVSELAMGTQTWGWVADEKTSHELADCYLEAGGNFFDTANIYNDGVFSCRRWPQSIGSVPDARAAFRG
jgi:aryl-alcohol dehydrogenase-like predicted oxidoreductase